jgi:Ca2+-binding RTX toxin-like protein
MLRTVAARLQARRRQRRPTHVWPLRLRPEVEPLGIRVVPTLTTSFVPATGLLTVTGDSAHESALLTKDASGNILLNGAAIANGPTMTNTTEIRLFGNGGSDTLSADLPGFAGPVTLDGGLESDFLLVFGTTGNDTLVGGDEAGTFDTLFVTADANLTLSGNLSAATLTGHGTDSLDGIEYVYLLGGPGDNKLDASAFDVQGVGYAVIDGKAGNDTLIGSNGPDILSDTGGGDDVLEGRDGNDKLEDEDGGGNDLLNGGEGHDSLYDVGGDDTMIGGGGIDYLEDNGGVSNMDGGTEDDTFVIFQGAGNDTVLGGGGNDRLFQWALMGAGVVLTDTSLTGMGSDTLGGLEGVSLQDTGTAGNNVDASAFTGSATLRGGEGDDTLLGGSGDDSLEGESGNDSLAGNGGHDLLYGGTGDDAIDGGQGNDTAEGFTGDDTILGGTGNDTLYGMYDNDSLDGGSGNDLLSSFADVPSVTTTTNDTLTGGEGSDTLEGGPGDDVYVFGTAGAAAETDRVEELADGGTDRLDFGALAAGNAVTVVLTNDAPSNLASHANRVVRTTAAGQAVNFENVTGGAGNDKLTGNAAANSLAGGDGNDTLSGAAGDDTLAGGAGTDRLAETGNVNFTLTDTALTGLGTDTLSGIDRARLTGGSGSNTLNAAGFTGAATLNGGTGKDTLVGGAGNDSLLGDAGHDVLIGGAGNDTLRGGADRDLLVGGSGADSLVGEAGDDVLVGGLLSYHDEGSGITDAAALTGIRKEWARSISYGTRVDHLRGTLGGGQNDPYFVNATTVSNEAGAVDTLFGNTETDWFVVSAGDLLKDRVTGEIKTTI